MIQLKSVLKVIDNSGALLVECINVIGTRGRIARTGDEIVCVSLSIIISKVVKKARNLEASSSVASSNAAVAKLVSFHLPF
jgi:large subunit ribosomal protein L14